MALFDSLKVVTDGDWALECSAKAARFHRCFTSHFNTDDAYEPYKKLCSELIKRVVKEGTYFKTKKYAFNCLDIKTVDDEFLEKWFQFAPTVIPYIKREQRPVLFINDVISLSTGKYEWGPDVIPPLKMIMDKYQKTHVIYCDDTESLYHRYLMELGFQKIMIGSIVYWRCGGK